MEKQALAVVTEFINAVKTLDLERVGALLHPDVKWYQPGRNQFSGPKNSVAEVFRMVGGMFEVSLNTMKLDQAKVFALNGGSVAVSLIWKASRPGAELDTENIDVYTVENGKIIAVTVFATDLQQEDAFWGN